MGVNRRELFFQRSWLKEVRDHSRRHAETDPGDPQEPSPAESRDKNAENHECVPEGRNRLSSDVDAGHQLVAECLVRSRGDVLGGAQLMVTHNSTMPAGLAEHPSANWTRKRQCRPERRHGRWSCYGALGKG